MIWHNCHIWQFFPNHENPKPSCFQKSYLSSFGRLRLSLLQWQISALLPWQSLFLTALHLENTRTRFVTMTTSNCELSSAVLAKATLHIQQRCYGGFETYLSIYIHLKIWYKNVHNVNVAAFFESGKKIVNKSMTHISVLWSDVPVGRTTFVCTNHRWNKSVLWCEGYSMVTFWLGLGTNITLIFRERLWFGLKEGLS